LGVVALAVWFGGGIVAGFVAPPAAFKFLETERQLAGSIAGYVLGRFQVICLISGAVYCLSWIFARLTGGRPHRWALPLVIVALLLAAYAHFALDPQIATLRDTLRAAGDTPELKGQFGALHQRSVVIFAIQWLLAAAALALHSVSLSRR
jgi:uncharacterized membrane protein